MIFLENSYIQKQEKPTQKVGFSVKKIKNVVISFQETSLFR